MRSMFPCFMLLVACSQAKDPGSTIATGNFAGERRDSLCIAGDVGNYRAGFIAFGAGDVNCSVSGRIEMQSGKISIVPRGEGACRIPISIEGDTVRIGEVPAACSYYCGLGASMAGTSFNRADAGVMATDLAGDPLC